MARAHGLLGLAMQPWKCQPCEFSPKPCSLPPTKLHSPGRRVESLSRMG